MLEPLIMLMNFKSSQLFRPIVLLDSDTITSNITNGQTTPAEHPFSVISDSFILINPFHTLDSL